MGKGDKKTKRGKIIMGSFGVRRPRKQSNAVTSVKKSVDPKEESSKPKSEEVLKEKKKTAPKKVASKQTEEAVTIAPKKKPSTKSAKKDAGKES